MSPFSTTDLCDAHPDLAVLPPVFRNFGGRSSFAGPIETIRVEDDNVLVRAALEEPGAGRILVIDGGGSLACALLGDQLAALGLENGWVGVIVHGCVRDVATLASLPFGVRAIASHPRKSGKRGIGERGVLLDIEGVRLAPGATVYADADGIVVSDRAIG